MRKWQSFFFKFQWFTILLRKNLCYFISLNDYSFILSSCFIQDIFLLARCGSTLGKCHAGLIQHRHAPLLHRIPTSATMSVDRSFEFYRRSCGRNKRRRRGRRRAWGCLTMGWINLMLNSWNVFHPGGWNQQVLGLFASHPQREKSIYSNS